MPKCCVVNGRLGNNAPEVEIEACALIFSALKLNVSHVKVYRTLDYGQSKPRARYGADITGTEEGLKQLSLILAWNTPALIHYRDRPAIRFRIHANLHGLIQPGVFQPI
jgi:hypothetical protein